LSDAVSFIAGFLAGFIGGLLPGLHSNTIISVLASLGLDDQTLAVMIISLYPAHLVSSYVPSIFFGVPDASNLVAVLPGQRMVRQGNGLLALRTVLFSCIFAALLSAALFEVSMGVFPAVYGIIKGQIGTILLLFTITLLLRSKNPILSAAIFILAGILGQMTLKSTMPDPFLPLFSGMFAMAAMINYKKTTIPAQRDHGALDSGFVMFVVIGVLLGMAADLLPGVGSPSQVATFATMFMRMDTPGYLATISAISTSQSIFSLSTSASIGKSRVGATAWLEQFIDINENILPLIILFLLSLSLSSAAVFLIRNHIAKIASIDFSGFNLILAIYLVLITFIINGAWGVAVLVLASALGVLCTRLNVERTTLMGAIIFPTLLLLFRIF